ncbi:rCG54994 [Rattus norvegicus]|uniref:RCG54994 n=1 Tax=Rattus norvegicus TaxID=10116 RepID=A6II70_RAT|nr:rCG54994 [Rattus norvegicus]
MDEFSGHAKDLTLSTDLERTVGRHASILFDFEKEESVINSSDKEIIAEAEKNGCKATGPVVLTEALFNEKMRGQIKKYRCHFPRCCHSNQRLRGTVFTEGNA